MRAEAPQLAPEALEAGLDHIRRSPQVEGTLDLIVRRPNAGAREVLQAGELDVAHGLVGDTWSTRGSSRTPRGASHLDMQLNIMNARVIDLLAQDRSRWALAGDQLFVDLDLSAANLPAGTRLAVGSALVEVTAQPHTGCRKFADRFGLAAMKFVNTPTGRQLNLRGINAKVVQGGAIRVGDPVRKLVQG